ncbi:hypothetical protein BO79DRAFT_259722 [Aspergillus costaricaensis CBS 115574]|uniref:Uncharacterized protein n=1 Tax=Aspergillus costaricaensis CBS 115574 TaxID=1448317 RepID=A0ACD1I1M0_9EURO|nr:hypothetical protein BO79DRAFT_259722 [Aspergillus costaricaensis CBS 115574]RAK83890.1 hypothetical protein BO79DRAFT_259722 [Aspergillus costaricaensis CBS 115574]
MQIPYGAIIALSILLCVYLNDRFENRHCVFIVIFLLLNIAGAFGLHFVPPHVKVGRLICYNLTGPYNAAFVLILSMQIANTAEGRYIDEDGIVHPPRYDTDTFRCLYGVEPNIAEIINYTPTIQVLEQHATEASDRLEATEVLKARFDTFLRALKEAGYPGNYLNLMSPEYHQFKERRSAYREYWNAT